MHIYDPFIERRRFLKTASCAALAAAASALVRDVGAQTFSTRRPNILHIHADDHRPDGLHALGNPVLKTPHLDTLVERGMAFTCCYTQGSMVGAVCLPSRTMLLTGRSWLRFKAATDPAAYLPRVLSAAGCR